MRQETVGVTENLLKSAIEEFLEKGLMKANLRKISAKSVCVRSVQILFIFVLKIKKDCFQQSSKKQRMG